MPAVATFDAIFKANTTQAKAALRDLRAEMALMTNNMNAAIGFAKNAASVIGKATIGAFVGVTIATVASIAAVKEYNKNIVHAGAIADLTKKEIDSLSKSINLLSVQFGQSGTDMAAGVVELTKAGLNMQEISIVMDDITKAMLANGIAFEQAAQIAVYSVKQFGGEEGFGSLERLFDQIQKVTQETIMDFGDLQQALQYAGSTAILAGVPFENLLAIMGTLSQRAMETGIASRSVNQMMMNLIDSSEEMQAWVDEMGLGVDVIKDGKLNLDELIQSLSSMDVSMEFLQESMEIFTVRALRSWGLLISGADEYKEILLMLDDASGTLQQVYEAQQNTIAFQLAQLREIFLAPMRDTGFTDSLIELLKDLKEPVAELSRTLFTGLFNFLKWTKENAGNITDFLQSFLDFAIKLLNPLYQMGKFLVEIGDGFLGMVLYWKIFASMNSLHYMTAFTEQLRFLTAEIVFHQVSLKTTLATLANFGAMMAGIAMGAYIMGRAYGKSMLDMVLITVTLSAALAALQAAIQVPGGPGIKAAAFAATFTAVEALGMGAYALGASKYKAMETPDMSGFENILNNVSYTPTGGTTTSTSGTTGGTSFGGSPTTITNYNIYGTMVAENDFENRILRSIDGS